MSSEEEKRAKSNEQDRAEAKKRTDEELLKTLNEILEKLRSVKETRPQLMFEVTVSRKSGGEELVAIKNQFYRDEVTPDMAIEGLKAILDAKGPRPTAPQNTPPANQPPKAAPPQGHNAPPTEDYGVIDWQAGRGEGRHPAEPGEPGWVGVKPSEYDDEIQTRAKRDLLRLVEEGRGSTEVSINGHLMTIFVSQNGQFFNRTETGARRSYR